MKFKTFEEQFGFKFDNNITDDQIDIITNWYNTEDNPFFITEMCRATTLSFESIHLKKNIFAMKLHDKVNMIVVAAATFNGKFAAPEKYYESGFANKSFGYLGQNFNEYCNTLKELCSNKHFDQVELKKYYKWVLGNKTSF